VDPKISLGLGVIHAEKGEIRAFLPDFVEKTARYFKSVVLEEGYGTGLGHSPNDYTKAKNVRFASAKKVYKQDIVLVLRYPPDHYLELMPPGACLISMCHFNTRPGRRDFLQSREIKAISLDAIRDDNGQRLVENLRAVAWNGCEVAFGVMEKIWPNGSFRSPRRDPIRITLLGSGGVGANTVQAAIRYGDQALWTELSAKGVPGNVVQVVDHDLTNHPEKLERLLMGTDLLIDATQRQDPTNIIVPNRMVGLMPINAVILDLSVDPYDCQSQPPEVKGIEGIPQGDLDQYIFAPDDPAWGSLPCKVETSNRRWTVSCYSWPGLHPRTCMARYGNQLRPLLRRLAKIGGVSRLNPDGHARERALTRGLMN
jgi:alanine dehydrogenase